MYHDRVKTISFSLKCLRTTYCSFILLFLIKDSKIFVYSHLPNADIAKTEDETIFQRLNKPVEKLSPSAVGSCRRINELCDETMPCCEEYWCVRIPLTVVKGICMERVNMGVPNVEKKESFYKAMGLPSDRPSWAKLLESTISRDELASSIAMNNFNLLPMNSDHKNGMITKNILTNLGRFFSSLGTFQQANTNSDPIKTDKHTANTKEINESDKKDSHSNINKYIPGETIRNESNNSESDTFTNRGNLKTNGIVAAETSLDPNANLPLSMLKMESEFTGAILANDPEFTKTSNKDRNRNNDIGNKLFGISTAGFYMPSGFDTLHYNRQRYENFIKGLQSIFSKSQYKKLKTLEGEIKQKEFDPDREIVNSNVRIESSKNGKYDIIVNQEIEKTVDESEFNRLKNEIVQNSLTNKEYYKKTDEKQGAYKNPQEINKRYTQIKEEVLSQKKTTNTNEITEKSENTNTGNITTKIYLPDREMSSGRKWHVSDFEGASIVHEAKFKQPVNLQLETSINILNDDEQEDTNYYRDGKRKTALNCGCNTKPKNTIDYVDKDEETLYGKSNENGNDYETKPVGQYPKHGNIEQMENENIAALAERNLDGVESFEGKNLDQNNKQIPRNIEKERLEKGQNFVGNEATDIKNSVIPKAEDKENSWEFFDFTRMDKTKRPVISGENGKRVNLLKESTEYIDMNTGETKSTGKYLNNVEKIKSNKIPEDLKNKSMKTQSKDANVEQAETHSKSNNKRQTDYVEDNLSDDFDNGSLNSERRYDFNDQTDLDESLAHYGKKIEKRYNVKLIPQYSIFVKETDKNPIGRIDFQVDEENLSSTVEDEDEERFENNKNEVYYTDYEDDDYVMNNDNNNAGQTRLHENQRNKDKIMEERNGKDKRKTRKDYGVKLKGSNDGKETKKDKLLFSKRMKTAAENLLLMVFNAEKLSKTLHSRHREEISTKSRKSRKTTKKDQKTANLNYTPSPSTSNQENSKVKKIKLDDQVSVTKENIEYWSKNKNSTKEDLKKIEKKIDDIENLFADMLTTVGESLNFIKNDHVRLRRSEVSKLKSLLTHIKESKVQLQYKIVTAEYSYRECLQMMRLNLNKHVFKKNSLLDGFFTAEQEAVKRLDEVEEKIKDDLINEIEYYNLIDRARVEDPDAKTNIDFNEIETKLDKLRKRILDLYKETRIVLRRYLRSLKGYLKKRGFYKDRLKIRVTKPPYFFPEANPEPKSSSEMLFRYVTDKNYVPPPEESSSEEDKTKEASKDDGDRHKTATEKVEEGLIE